MKLFLASSPYLNDIQINRLLDLVGKEKLGKVLVINTAVVPYGLNPKPDWYLRSIAPLQSITAEIEEVSLINGHTPASDLSNYDLIYVSGGNTFYLAYQLNETGWANKIIEYVRSGGVYSGSSAGSIILMGNIEHFAPADDPSQAPKIYPGLDLIKEAIIPHSDNQKYGQIMASVSDVYRNIGYKVVPLNDDQVYIISENFSEVV